MLQGTSIAAFILFYFSCADSITQNKCNARYQLAVYDLLLVCLTVSLWITSVCFVSNHQTLRTLLWAVECEQVRGFVPQAGGEYAV